MSLLRIVEGEAAHIPRRGRRRRYGQGRRRQVRWHRVPVARPRVHPRDRRAGAERAARRTVQRRTRRPSRRARISRQALGRHGHPGVSTWVGGQHLLARVPHGRPPVPVHEPGVAPRRRGVDGHRRSGELLLLLLLLLLVEVVGHVWGTRSGLGALGRGTIGTVGTNGNIGTVGT